MAYGVVRTDNMHGTVFGGDLVSVRYKESGAAKEIENGNFCVPGAYEEDEREVRVGAKPAANSALNTLVLIASEEVDETKKYNTLAEFINKAGSICRGYKLNKGEIFSLTEEAFDKASGVTPTVGTSILEAQASVKGKLVNSATSGSTKIADLIAIEGIWYVFQIA